MLRGIQHAGDDHVDLTMVQRLHQPVKRDLDKHRLLAHRFRHPFGDLHIIAIAIKTVMVFNRRIVLGGAVLLPVVGNIGKLAADAHGIRIPCGTVRLAAASGKKQQRRRHQHTHKLFHKAPSSLLKNCSFRLFWMSDLYQSYPAAGRTIGTSSSADHHTAKRLSTNGARLSLAAIYL